VKVDEGCSFELVVSFVVYTHAFFCCSKHKDPFSSSRLVFHACHYAIVKV
jgi:hypothetical protein